MNIIKYITNWKYRYFLKKLDGVKKMIADFEFKRFKTEEIREDVRNEYDALKARLQALETQEKQPLKKEELAKLKDQKALTERDLKRYEDQMKGLDLEINGSKKTNEYPEGVNGIVHQLDALRELQEMLKEYIKEL